jgi:hypothetical protein
MMTSERMRWVGHVTRMAEKRTLPCKIIIVEKYKEVKIV